MPTSPGATLPPHAPPTLSRIDIEQAGPLLRITIPFRTREKIWMTVALTVMLLFGTMMATIAEIAIRSATTIHAVWIIPFLVLAVVLGFYLLSLLAIRSMPGTLIELDGGSLSISTIGSDRRTTIPRQSIKSITISRLPMVPIANLVIQTDANPGLRVGTAGRRDLDLAADRLRQALKLPSRKRK